MRRGLTMALAMALVCGLGVSAVNAGPGCCAAAKKGKVVKASSSDKSPCHVGDFPTMAIKVGDKTYNCPVTAEQVAKEAGSKVIFVVGNETFDDKDKALCALACASEQYVGKFTAIACVVDGKLVYCDDKTMAHCAGSAKKASAKAGCCAKAKKGSVAKAKADGKSCHGDKQGKFAKASGKSCCSKQGKLAKAGGKAVCDKSKCEKFFVLGREFKSYEAAVKARDEAAAAVKKIKMTYVVDGKKVDCASKVCPTAKAAGKVQFVVNDAKTHCEFNARVTLARAQFEAAKTVAEKLTEL